MLKISWGQQTSDEPMLRLEGDISGPWVDELREAIAVAVTSAKPVHLDLSGVRYADEAGVRLLQEIIQQGATLNAPSSFLRILLTGLPNP
jgi:ABC-type transporter Mla MlaB component